MQSAYVFSLDYFLINNQILRLRFLGGERRGGLRPHQLSPYRNQERIIYSNCFSWILTEICLLSIELHALENSFWVVIFTFALDICTSVYTLISFFQKVWALLIQETINVPLCLLNLIIICLKNALGAWRNKKTLQFCRPHWGSGSSIQIAAFTLVH